jgi:hypothetical protein
MPRARGALLPALVLLAARAAAAAAGDDPACGTFALTSAAASGRYVLPHGFVRAGSDSVWTARGPLRRGVDYALDALRGEVRVLVPTAPGETLWVATCWLLEPPPLEYRLHEYHPVSPSAAPASADSAAAPRPRPATGRDPGEAIAGSSLAVTGNKTVAVEFGSAQDAALRQSLDLAVRGTLAPGVELSGVLSDRNTPLSAAGSTQDLQALDRVLIELRAPHASAALGDVPLAVDRGQFAKLDRQAQGVRGEWHQGGFEGSIAAAGAQGEYVRTQFTGVDGLQGPYLLPGRDGATGITVIAGSEVVTIDGARLSRGESADYAMDYDRGRITFTNRRPITSSSRVTVEYQAALGRYRRNLAAFSGGWHSARARLWTAAVSEADDRGRPLAGALDATDRAALAAAGDSAMRALGPGLLPGPGDYDTVRVAPGTVVVAWAGPDSGQFVARFARVGPGRGDYADSAIVAGKTAYRWVGPGQGAFVLGRALPLPESHQLATLGGSVTAGPLTLEAEGAFSRFDANIASPRDDRDDQGGAGRAALVLEGGAGPLPGRAGVSLAARSVERRFTPFSRLERAFAEEDWGLPAGADLDHQRRQDASAFWRPRERDELRFDLSRLATPDGYDGTRRRAEWTGEGRLRTHALWLDADGSLAGVRRPRGGRTRALLEVARAGRWLTPSLRLESDDRRAPSDSLANRTRSRELAADLGSGDALRWKLGVGTSVRSDQQPDAPPTGGSTPGLSATALRGSAESPPGGPIGVAVTLQHRLTRDLITRARTLSDLGGVKLRAEHRPSGLSGQIDVERTSEADDERVRTLTFVGAGRGAYDALGNFVGTGDYDLRLALNPVLERFARVATSARAQWRFGAGDAWRGSRVEFTLEDEARRRGGAHLADVFLSTGLALVDPALLRGSILQRLESELAPGSRAAAILVRAERRVSADRATTNFTQTTDQRTGSLRWRARPGAAVTLETEARVQWQSAVQAVSGGASYARTLIDDGATSRLVWQRGAALRLVGALELDLARPLGQAQSTRTVRVGPDAGLQVGARGRLDASVRRAFVSGPPAVGLLPSADPAGFARWDANAHFDLRLHETTTFGLGATLEERPGRATRLDGRAEVRAFF